MLSLTRRGVLAGSAALAAGTLILPRGPIRRAPAEIQRRIAVAACRWVTGADYPPRRAAVAHALAGLSASTRVTLELVVAI